MGPVISRGDRREPSSERAGVAGLRENASWAGEVEDKSFTGLHRLNGAPLNGAPHVEIHAEVVGDHVTGIDRDCLAWLQVDDVDRAVDGQHYFTVATCPQAEASLTAEEVGHAPHLDSTVTP